MSKGTSNVIISVLLAAIAISLVAALYSWLPGNAAQTQQEAESIYGSKTNDGCLRLESIDTSNKKITVRNCGQKDLSNVVVFVDSNPAVSQASVKAGSVVELDYEMSSGAHEVFVTSDSAQSSVVNIDTEGRMIAFDFWLTPDFGDKRLVCS
jgi:hypothetical protein